MDYSFKEHLNSINQQFKEITGIYRNAISQSGISENEFWIWYALIIMENECSQQDICAAWSLSKQTVNTIITNLTKKGFVFLEVIPGTRNRKLIHLTDEGRKYGESIVLPIYQAEQAAFDQLTQQDRTACTFALRKYIEFLKKEM